MIKLYLFIGLILTVSCQDASPKSESAYKMKCEKVSFYLERCENKEVICYNQRDFRGGVVCKFKGVEK